MTLLTFWHLHQTDLSLSCHTLCRVIDDDTIAHFLAFFQNIARIRSTTMATAKPTYVPTSEEMKDAVAVALKDVSQPRHPHEWPTTSIVIKFRIVDCTNSVVGFYADS